MDYPKGILIGKNGEDLVTLTNEFLVKGVKDLTPQVRSGSQFRDMGFYLTEKYDWIIVKDDQNVLVLLPLRKTIKVGKFKG